MTTWLDQARPLRADTVVAAHDPTMVRRGGFGPCPWCGVVQRSSKDKRPPVLWNKAGASCKCLACGVYGAGLWVAAGLVFGHAPRPGDNWRSVRDWLAGVALIEVDDPSTIKRNLMVAPRPAPVVLEELKPPPIHEVEALMRMALPVAKVPAVAAYLNERGIPANAPCGALPHGRNWPSWWAWGSLYPLLVGGYDGHGQLRSVHARAITDDVMGKTRWPKGFLAGWLFADPWKARPMLRGEDTEVERVIVVEGLTDYLSVAAYAQGDSKLAVIGGTAGSWRHLGDAPLPRNSTVYIATDNDPTGDKYAAEVASVLATHDCRRVHLTQPADNTTTTTTGENVNV